MIKIEISDYLYLKLQNFFPEEDRWKSNCFKRENIFSEEYLPCHLRDVDWLVALIIKKYDLYSLGEGTIKEYVRDSLYFNKLRSDYEQRIIKWQINLMRNGGDNWIIDYNYGGDLYLFNSKCDYAFRKGIVDTLLAIGMNIDAIEEGIEKNADMWRDSFMNLAFNNEFNPIFSNFRIRINSKEEVEKLKIYLEKKSQERYQEIEEFKKENSYQSSSENYICDEKESDNKSKKMVKKLIKK